MLFCSSGWTPKTGTSWTAYNIQEVPLQIYTDSTQGSGDMMWVRFKDPSRECGITVRFKNPPEYSVGYCTPDGIFPTFTMPDGDVKIWTITKYSTKVILHCNEVEIFNYKFSESTRAECQGIWSPEKTHFHFGTTDTASDFYRVAPNYGNLLFVDKSNG